jgi:hypothetical protein
VSAFHTKGRVKSTGRLKSTGRVENSYWEGNSLNFNKVALAGFHLGGRGYAVINI